jgi:tRNA pseudouridine55 synthase
MTGVLNLLKPPGMTSHDVVDVVRRLLRTKRVGHAGTLDPGAAGVLLVCAGEATRIVEYLMEGTKSYRAEVTFGVTTTTEDAQGTIVSEQSAADVTEERLRDVLTQFIGDIEQTPPMASAVQVGGKRLHELARRGETVGRPKRQVHVDEIQLLRFTAGERAVALLDVTCSKGTYVRTLAADVGAALGCGAHLSFLVRTRVGRFRLEESLTLEELQVGTENGTLTLIPLNDALSHIAQVTLDEIATKKIRNGQSISAEGIHHIGDLLRLCDEQGRLVAIAQCVENQKKEIVYQPQKVFKP